MTKKTAQERVEVAKQELEQAQRKYNAAESYRWGNDSNNPTKGRGRLNDARADFDRAKSTLEMVLGYVERGLEPPPLPLCRRCKVNEAKGYASQNGTCIPCDEAMSAEWRAKHPAPTVEKPSVQGAKRLELRPIEQMDTWTLDREEGPARFDAIRPPVHDQSIPLDLCKTGVNHLQVFT